MPTPEIKLQVTRYLERLLDQGFLQNMTVDKAMIEIRKWIPMARQLSDSELRSMVQGFFLSRKVHLLAGAPMQSPDNGASLLINAVKKALKLATDGAPIYETHTGKITISVKGLTAKSSGRSPSTSLNVSWTGTLSTVMTGGNFTLRNSLSRSGWSISLSYPKDTPVFDSTRVGAVFGAAGDMVAGIIEQSFALTDIKDVRSVADRFTSYAGTVANAIEAVQGIGTRPKQGLSVSIQVGSAPPSAGHGGKPGAIEGFVTLTYSW